MELEMSIDFDKILWGELIQFRKICDENDSVKCVNALRHYKRIIDMFIKKKILSYERNGTFSVCRSCNSSALGSDRLDPSLFERYFSFTRREYAEDYMQEMKKMNGLRKIYVVQWPMSSAG